MTQDTAEAMKPGHTARWIGDTVGAPMPPECLWNCNVNHSHHLSATSLGRRFGTLCECGHDYDEHRIGGGYCHRCSGDASSDDCRSFARLS